jgi:hypothetical protein
MLRISCGHCQLSARGQHGARDDAQSIPQCTTLRQPPELRRNHWPVEGEHARYVCRAPFNARTIVLNDVGVGLVNSNGRLAASIEGVIDKLL